MKTEEEKIKQEKERLESLEEDRQRRMRGEQVTKNHVSVEDMGEENLKKTQKMTTKEKRKLLKELLRGEPETEEGDEIDDNENEAEEEDSGEEEDEESDDECEEPENEKDSYDQGVQEMIVTASHEIPYVIP